MSETIGNSILKHVKIKIIIIKHHTTMTGVAKKRKAETKKKMEDKSIQPLNNYFFQ